MKLKELFADPKRWTQGTSARGKSGRAVSPASQYAVCFCLLGGVIKCYPNTEEKEAVERKIEKRLKISRYWKWNDMATFEQVKKLVNELDI